MRRLLLELTARRWGLLEARVRGWSWLAPAFVFGAILAISRPFVSNQNTYLAHAARLSGAYPQLQGDWFTTCADPTPIFSWLIAPLLQWFGPRCLPLVTAACAATFLASLVLLAEALSRPRTVTATRWVVVCSLVALRFGAPHYQLWFEGVADQVLVRHFLEPATFGVLLLLGLALFERRRPWLGVVIVAASAALHPTYVPSAALVIVAHALFDQSPPRERAAVAVTGVVLLAPVIVYVLVVFGPSSPDVYQEAERILADIRIPHHTDPRRWLSVGSLTRALVVLSGIVLANGRGRKKLALFATYGLVGTLAALLFPRFYGLRLSFPWRVSAWLVPLSTAIILKALLEWHRRVDLAKALYHNPTSSACGTLRKIVRREPTIRWLVAPRQLPVDCHFAEPVFRNGDGVLYRLNLSLK